MCMADEAEMWLILLIPQVGLFGDVGKGLRVCELSALRAIVIRCNDQNRSEPIKKLLKSGINAV